MCCMCNTRKQGARFDYPDEIPARLAHPQHGDRRRAQRGSSAAVLRAQTHAIQAYNLQLADCIPRPREDSSTKAAHKRAPLQSRSRRSALKHPSAADVMPSHMLADSEEDESASAGA